MAPPLTSVCYFLALVHYGYAAMGPAYSTGPVSSGNFIREATSTLVVPQAPNPIIGNTVLWTGMGTSAGDLIQAITNNYPADTLGAVCSHLGGNWCVAATTLHKTSSSTQQEIAGPDSTTTPSSQVTMRYVYDDASGNYTQTAAVNGVVVSQISTSSGLAQGWGTAQECTTKPCGVVPAHSWINTTLIMNVADPNYSQTAYPTGAGVTGQIITTDGGKTWTAAKLGIPSWDCTTL
ncbi:hypothetical protein EV356DRAFT_567206 [Viridothelium virens]|uniref:Uncharacterized protein n=1 Tax=Viridothelium virens TaxID=1048519 RepID=A0A6A6H908_VIRVR|nr:hypothetical protein EV356DRAFT_567206 [Viridothelium virens]